MGGLFSSKPQPTPSPVRRPTVTNYSTSSYNSYSRRPEFASSTETYSQLYYRQQLEIQRRNLEILNTRISGEQSLNTRISGGQSLRCIQSPQKSVRNSLFDIPIYGNTYSLLPLSEYDFEFSRIKQMISNKRNFKVDSIEKISNPYLEKAYELKKLQKQSEYPYVEEKLLFHGTKRSNVDDICTNNFNWRLCQAHKFGRGVSFSPNSTYASNYSDKNIHQKIMIVAKVLIGQSCLGNENMDIPPSGCDTSQKGVDGVVIVKFEDNEFFPVYKINYHLIDENVGRRQNNRRRGGARFRQNSLDSDLFHSWYD